MRFSCTLRRPFTRPSLFSWFNNVDSFQSLRNLPFRKMQSGACFLTRQSGNIFWCRHCHLQVQFCHWVCLTTTCPLPHGGLCRSANMQSWLRCGRLVNRLQWSVHGCQIPHGWRKPWLSIAFSITVDVPPCSTHYVPSGTTPANVSHLRRFSMTCCSELPSEATGSASLLLVSLTRSSRPITCKEPTVA